jgi:ABC-type uncharacterized transport system substrate-binding protein
MIIYRIHSVLLGIFLSGSLLFPCWPAAAKEIAPILKDGGKKWRIGYLQGGEKGEEYAESLKALIAGLADLGWMPLDAVPEKEQNTTDFIWRQLAEKSGKYLEFVPNAYWSNGWNRTTRKANKDEIIKRLITEKDIDMMIAMGTWAGEDLADNSHNTNTIVINSSNPVEAGISKSSEFSGRPHIHVTIEADRYENQLLLFYNIFKFKTLGVVYEDSPEGRAFAAIEPIRNTSKLLNFTLVERVIPPEKNEQEIEKLANDSYVELSAKVDAVYITSHLGIKPEKMPNMLQKMLKYKVPTWSQAGCEEDVEHGGVLMAVERPSYKDLGLFQADVMAQIFHGTAPGDIPQNFDDAKSKSICLNLKTAKLIEFNPPWYLMAAVKRERIYWNIQEPLENREGEESSK